MWINQVSQAVVPALRRLNPRQTTFKFINANISSEKPYWSQTLSHTRHSFHSIFYCYCITHVHASDFFHSHHSLRPHRTAQSILFLRSQNSLKFISVLSQYRCRRYCCCCFFFLSFLSLAFATYFYFLRIECLHGTHSMPFCVRKRNQTAANETPIFSISSNCAFDWCRWIEIAR